MNVLMIDDDKSILKKLQTDFHNYFKCFNEKIDYEIKAENFLSIESTNVDVAFIDIDLVNYNGINLANYLTEKFPNIIIIFISAREDLVFQTLTTRVFQFIRKRKYDEDKVTVFAQLENHLNNHLKKKIIHYKGRSISIRPDKIKYILSVGHDVIILEERDVTIKSSMQSILEYFNSPYLIQIQRIMAVNFNYCLQITKTKIVTRDKKEYHVGRKYQQNLMNKYEEFLLKWLY